MCWKISTKPGSLYSSFQTISLTSYSPESSIFYWGLEETPYTMGYGQRWLERAESRSWSTSTQTITSLEHWQVGGQRIYRYFVCMLIIIVARTQLTHVPNIRFSYIHIHGVSYVFPAKRSVNDQFPLLIYSLPHPPSQMIPTPRSTLTLITPNVFSQRRY